MAESPEFISSRDTLERLVRLETKVHLKFDELERALVLARNVQEAIRKEAKDQSDKHFDRVNNFQNRIERMEETFITVPVCTSGQASVIARATSDYKYLDNQVSGLKKLFYIGVGVVMVLEIIFRFIVK